MKSTLLLGILVLAMAITSCKKGDKPSHGSNGGNDTTTTDTLTQLMIVNATDTPVVVWITLGATPGCLQQVSQIPYITDTIGNLVGSFVLGANDSTIAYAPPGMGFNGNVSFNTQPLNCPTGIFTQGVNIFEFIFNNSFQPGSPQETIDISCVAGVNCFIKTYINGGNAWNATTAYPLVDSIYNAGITDNSGLVGVYPYGCDVCTGAQSPPVCSPPSNDNDRQSQPICNVQRNASHSGGGIITVVYLGAN